MDEEAPRTLVVTRREHRTDGPTATFEAELRVPADLFYFRGHFEGDPILPGVVQLDSGVLALAEEAWPELEGGLRQVSRLKFVAPLRPGDRIAIRLVRGPDPDRVSFVIERGGAVCSSGLLRFEPGAGS